MKQAQVRTDWLGMMLSLLSYAIVVAGFVWAALQPKSWLETSGWAWGLFVLVPLEGLRAFVAGVTITVYREYRGPWQAVASFGSTMALTAVFVLVVLLLPGRHSNGMSFHDLAALLSSPRAWQIALIPMSVIVADGALGLLLYRGDPRVQATRLEAIATTSGFWLMVALIYPAIFVMPAIVLLLVAGSPRIVDPIFGHLAQILLFYAALYFAVKAILLAYLHTSRFLRTSRLPILGEKEDAIDERRAVLLGEPLTLREIIERQRSAKRANAGS